MPPVLAFSLAGLLIASIGSVRASDAAPTRDDVLATMRRATTFMLEKVSHRGGYVWSYLPDFSRRWGEMEAYPTMIWIQSGTPAMGQAFLDAYRATGDEFYYRAAETVGAALIAAQHRSGGWDYLADFAGEESRQRWYETIGRHGWRLEEFQYRWDNATFDDGTTIGAARFLLRLCLERREAPYGAALDRAIAFVLAAQYPNGGWPQRFPPAPAAGADGGPPYPAYITFNDDVAAGNIDFLLECHRALGDERLLVAARRGMDAFVTTRQPAPQAGWALQYTPDDLQPAAARSYEPQALATHATAGCIEQLLRFHELTGDEKFLAPIPAALDWLDAVRLPPALAGARGTHPTFLELGTNRPLFIHRRGSNVVSGKYYVDDEPGGTVGHYSSFRRVDVAGLRARHERARAGAPGLDNPARAREGREDAGGRGGDRVATIVAALNAEGWWPAPLRMTSHPYRGEPPREPAPGDFTQSQVGDEFDTSPFRRDTAIIGISVGTFMENMRVLGGWLGSQP